MSQSGAKKSPSSAKKSPPGAKKSPSSAKKSPPGAKKSPAGAKKSPAGAKKSPAGAKKSPAFMLNNLSSPNNQNVQTCRDIVLQQLKKSNTKNNFVTSNMINYSLIDSLMYSLDCQIKEIMDRLPITFVIGDVSTVSSLPSNVNVSTSDTIGSSPDPFSNDSTYNYLYQHLYNIDIDPVSLNNNINDTNLGKTSTRTKPPLMIVEHANLPTIYLKFVFLAAPIGDTGLQGVVGAVGKLGNTGATGPAGVDGYSGNPPLYMQ